MAFRPQLGATLQNMVLGEQPAYPEFRLPMPGIGTPPIQGGRMQPKPRGKGQLIAGALGDALAQMAGGNQVFLPSLAVERQRAADAEAADAQWTRRRQAENEDWTQRQQWQQAHPDPSPMMRDVAAWQAMTPDQRAAYEAMQKAKEGDPLVNVSLPNGQFYSGPRSGLASALQGQAPAAPVGRLTPIEGGPGGSPSGAGFRP